MLLKISKLSRFDKKFWHFKYSNLDFDEILNSILNNMLYDYIELSIWSFQLDLFDNVEYTLLDNNYKFLKIRLDKIQSIKILEPRIYEEIRFFEINIFGGNEKFFNIKSDNYGECTSIVMSKTIDEEGLLALIDDVFANS